jgi:signal transduction histidine kinase
VRLLGGTLAIESSPGRGTRIAASMPKWQARPDAQPVSA